MTKNKKNIYISEIYLYLFLNSFEKIFIYFEMCYYLFIYLLLKKKKCEKTFNLLGI